MREWYALDTIARYREMYPDLTRKEEDDIFNFHMADDGRCLFFRCTMTIDCQPQFGQVPLKVEKCSFVGGQE